MNVSCFIVAVVSDAQRCNDKPEGGKYAYVPSGAHYQNIGGYTPQ